MEGQRRNRILRKKPLIVAFYVVVIVVQELSAFATYSL
jgi:hypothetical protein